MKKILLFLSLVGQIFAFDKTEFAKELSNLDANNSTQTQKLLDLSQEWQDENIANLTKLKTLKNQEFVEYFLLDQRLNFLLIATQTQNQNKFDKTLEFYKEYLQEKVDFLLSNGTENLAKFNELETCVGDPCGHPTEVLNLAGILQALKEMQNVDLQIVKKISAQAGKDYKSYLYERSFTEQKSQLLELLHEKSLEAHFEALATFSSKNEEIVSGFHNYFFYQYLTRLYTAQFYAGFLIYDDKKHGIGLNKVKKYIKLHPEICTIYPEFLRKEIAELCK
ncbi:hypothetical protein [Campylobacter sp. VBCF_01 NA2]|uniref:hypothetical protein n=1 Tax=Campylobacter sp. VBCF_01 NA2 TaxID=2983836 RepID=UPI0022E9A53D|nr:hypothetical protein [Campylobacter sp. VBCF_01 NA2]WBR54725.1 hypothetical protein PF027_02310 [Campylobacter sp. VBCF_01 NA2]